MPEGFYLEEFGRMLFDVFGTRPFLVGTAAVGKKWRDVDVRVILSDKEFVSWFGLAVGFQSNKKWCAVCAAFSELGRKMTGLPIDFQVQPQRTAKQYDGHARSALIPPYIDRKGKQG